MTADSEVTKYHIDEKFIIRDVETLKVLADPLRLRIIQSIGDKPHTVKQISRLLGLPPNKLYYHINMLEEHGIIRVVDTRIVSGIIEKIYLIRAHYFTPAHDLLSTATDDGSNMRLMLDGIFEETKQSLIASMQAGLVEIGEHEDEETLKIEKSNVSSVRLMMTREQADEFSDRLKALIEECHSQEKSNDDVDVHPYRMLLVYFPQVERADDEEE